MSTEMTYYTDTKLDLRPTMADLQAVCAPLMPHGEELLVMTSQMDAEVDDLLERCSDSMDYCDACLRRWLRKVRCHLHLTFEGLKEYAQNGTQIVYGSTEVEQQLRTDYYVRNSFDYELLCQLQQTIEEGCVLEPLLTNVCQRFSFHQLNEYIRQVLQRIVTIVRSMCDDCGVLMHSRVKRLKEDVHKITERMRGEWQAAVAPQGDETEIEAVETMLWCVEDEMRLSPLYSAEVDNEVQLVRHFLSLADKHIGHLVDRFVELFAQHQWLVARLEGLKRESPQGARVRRLSAADSLLTPYMPAEAAATAVAELQACMRASQVTELLTRWVRDGFVKPTIVTDAGFQQTICQLLGYKPQYETLRKFIQRNYMG